jgi:hypothetical protein
VVKVITRGNDFLTINTNYCPFLSFTLGAPFVPLGVNVDDSAVLTSFSSADSWVFTPVGTLTDFGHPLSGHRQFGLNANDDGSFTFYTRGVDMMWSFLDVGYNSSTYSLFTTGLFGFEGQRFFDTADELWNFVMDGTVDYINSNGGEALKTHNFSRRID